MTLTASDSVPALIAGNAVVTKTGQPGPLLRWPAPSSTFEAGLPRELYAVVPGPGSVVGTGHPGELRLPDVHRVDGHGRQLAEQCGRRLIGFSAELGGKERR